MIPDPRKGRKKERDARDRDEPEPLEPGALPEEPENLRSPEKPTPRRKPPANWADDER